MANHGPFCKRIKNDKENSLKLIMWKRQRMLKGAFLKSLSIILEHAPTKRTGCKIQHTMVNEEHLHSKKGNDKFKNQINPQF